MADLDSSCSICGLWTKIQVSFYPLPFLTYLVTKHYKSFMFWRRRKIFVYVDNEFWETLTLQNVNGFLVDQIGVNVEIRNLLCDITP